VLFVVTFGSVDESVDPWEELLGAVIGVEDNWDSVLFSEGAYVECSGDGTGDCGGIIGVVKVLSGVELDWICGEVGWLEMKCSLCNGRRLTVILQIQWQRVQTYLRSTRRELNDDGRIVLASSLKTRVDMRGRNTVHGGNGVSYMKEKNKKR